MKIRIELTGHERWDRAANALSGEWGEVVVNRGATLDANFPQYGAMFFGVPVRVCSVDSGGVITPPDESQPLPPVDPEPEPPNPIDAAEAHIGQHFSTPRLLQMKVWWDTFPHEVTPKLAATYQWTDTVTRSAIGGATEFPDPPFSFQSIAEEIVNIES